MQPDESAHHNKLVAN